MTRALRKSIGGTLAVCMIVLHAPSHASGNGGGHAGSPVAPPLLSQTGLYEKDGAFVVDHRNRPYSPQYPLWSDGAHKERWVFLPAGAPIDIANVDSWVFPVGTKFW